MSTITSTTSGDGGRTGRGSGSQGAGAYRPGESARQFDPSNTMLLVIDPVNDFLSEGGAA